MPRRRRVEEQQQEEKEEEEEEEEEEAGGFDEEEARKVAKRMALAALRSALDELGEDKQGRHQGSASGAACRCAGGCCCRRG